MKSILIVEDDDNLCRGIAFAFEKDGCRILSASTVSTAKQMLEQNSVDLILLDLGLPDGDGISFCREIRRHSQVPVIMLTARDLETDQVAGLLSGADDYVTKPFSLAVLRARVEALFRRASPDSRSVLRSGRYQLNTDLCKFYLDEEEIALSATEYRLLAYFMRHPGQVLSKEQILSALWDSDGNFVDDNTVSVNISRLRSKIGDGTKTPQVIETVRGIGYVWIGGK